MAIDYGLSQIINSKEQSTKLQNFTRVTILIFKLLQIQIETNVKLLFKIFHQKLQKSRKPQCIQINSNMKIFHTSRSSKNQVLDQIAVPVQKFHYSSIRQE
jgi:hypothetical protein